MPLKHWPRYRLEEEKASCLPTVSKETKTLWNIPDVSPHTASSKDFSYSATRNRIKTIHVTNTFWLPWDHIPYDFDTLRNFYSCFFCSFHKLLRNISTFVHVPSPYSLYSMLNYFPHSLQTVWCKFSMSFKTKTMSSKSIKGCRHHFQVKITETKKWKWVMRHTFYDINKI